ncbi:MAG TPA: hypothetical protein VKF36_14305 [Syntrophorhabdales bacterium]|nr:hypothetical protein [Syntrophorhabdales bacterium]
MEELAVKNLLGQYLNEHGYSFQYAVLKAINDLYDEGKSPWLFEVAEFPVEVNGTPTHIDFILRHKEAPFYLVAECKRANPAISNWCFVKAPYVSRDIRDGNERIVREVVNANGGTSLQWLKRTQDIYRLAFEVKSTAKGEGSSGRGQVNDALTQVLRGVNGLIKFAVDGLCKGKTALLKGQSYAAFMPVIFTTANLWVTDAVLSKADLLKGTGDISKFNLTARDQILFHYAQSPTLKHSSYNYSDDPGLSDVLYLEYTRSIPIVSASAIAGFLPYINWSDLDDWNK